MAKFTIFFYPHTVKYPRINMEFIFRMIYIRLLELDLISINIIKYKKKILNLNDAYKKCKNSHKMPDNISVLKYASVNQVIYNFHLYIFLIFCCTSIKV